MKAKMMYMKWKRLQLLQNAVCFLAVTAMVMTGIYVFFGIGG